MTQTVYVTGHRNPDTDSIVSAIAYSHLKNHMDPSTHYIASRIGEVNPETEFVLKRFGFSLPRLIHTVKTQVRDLDYDRPPLIQENISIRQAWTMMHKVMVKTLPVVHQGKLKGIITAGDIAEYYIESSGKPTLNLNTSLENLLDTLSASLVSHSDDFSSHPIKGRVVIVTSSTKNDLQPGDIAIVDDFTESQLQAVEAGASCIILCGSSAPNEELISKASSYRCPIVLSPYDIYGTSHLIHQSVPVSKVMKTKKLVTFHLDEFLDDVQEVMLETRFRSYPVLNDGNEVVGSISRFHLIRPNRKKVILVDHNEKSQSVQGLEQAEILEIIDHHRIADIQTGFPILFRNEPLGSTSTIIANQFFSNGITPTPEIAGILLSAILSDTVLFKSPTCTMVDRITAEKLAELANVDLESFGNEMFKATTSIVGKDIKDILYQDYKEFHLGNKHVAVSQASTMDISEFEPIKNDLLSLMENVCKKDHFDLVILMITDILREGSELLFVGKDTDIIAKAFQLDFKGNSVYLPGVISRKKQVIPPISAIIG